MSHLHNWISFSPFFFRYSDTPVVASIVRKFFNSNSAVELTEILIRHYMVLTESVLELWKSDPEELIHTELSDAYQDR